jgi:catechol 2,3-dioxygenase-like lactoylglutathione lyase family enzyme
MAKLRHIAITVPDPEKAAQFYERAFGLKRVGRTDWHGAHGVYLSDGVINLALLHYKMEEFAGRRGRDFVGVHHFGFIVDDVAETRRRIEAAGGRHWMGEPPEGASSKGQGGGFYEVKFHDPDGVAFDITANGWTGAAKD